MTLDRFADLAGPPVVAFVLGVYLVRALSRGALGSLALDRPNERSLHTRPVPRTGGVGIVLAVAVAWFAGTRPPLAIWAGAAFLAAVSFADDLRGLPVAVRFGAHGLAAAGSAWVLVGAGEPLLFAMAVLGTLWLTNLYNFMDGSDGLAGGMAVSGFGAYGAAAALAGDASVAVPCLALAAAAAAFLVYNFHPARIFMGDAGSIPLGFLAGTLGLWGWRRGLWPLWFPALVFSPFVVDATVTLARRALRGEKVWQAHKQHYYQRLVRMGWGHRATALAEYAVMAAAALSALAGLALPVSGQAALLAGWAAAYLAIAVTVDRAWARFPEGSR